MGKPYSEDLRRNVVHAIESGHTYEEAAELCGVSISSVSRFLTRWRNTGSVGAEKFGGYKGHALERYKHRVTRWLGAPPGITLAELHKVAGIREAIAARGAILRYLPTYSPDLNPIEQFFSKLKAILRKAAARFIEALWETIRSCLADFSPRECAAYLTHAGYGQPYRKMD